jgi:hypothetical protein
VSWEEIAIYKHPRSGKCEKSCFAGGDHRVGLVPIASVLDGGASGCSCREICLECEKMFDEPKYFVLRKQPNRLRTNLSRGIITPLRPRTTEGRSDD